MIVQKLKNLSQNIKYLHFCKTYFKENKQTYIKVHMIS